MIYNPNTREQVFLLKDGRTIFKTHNGFKCFVETKKGIVSPIDQKYFTQSLKLAVK